MRLLSGQPLLRRLALRSSRSSRPHRSRRPSLRHRAAVLSRSRGRLLVGRPFLALAKASRRSLAEVSPVVLSRAVEVARSRAARLVGILAFRSRAFRVSAEARRLMPRQLPGCGRSTRLSGSISGSATSRAGRSRWLIRLGSRSAPPRISGPPLLMRRDLARRPLLGKASPGQFSPRPGARLQVSRAPGLSFTAATSRLLDRLTLRSRARLPERFSALASYLFPERALYRSSGRAQQRQFSKARVLRPSRMLALELRPPICQALARQQLRSSSLITLYGLRLEQDRRPSPQPLSHPASGAPWDLVWPPSKVLRPCPTGSPAYCLMSQALRCSLNSRVPISLWK